jgi:hypothetical protein
LPDGDAQRGIGRRSSPVAPGPPFATPGLGAPTGAGRRIVEPGPVVVRRPQPQDLADRLIDRTGRVRLPEPPRTRVRPGTVAEPVVVGAEELSALLRSTGDQARIVWSRAGSEIAVQPGRFVATTADGGIVVTVPVQTEQTGAVDVQVPLAAGTGQRDAGLLLSTSSRPLGPAIVVDRWGEALVALVWQALLQVAVALAARAGTDDRGEPLVPASLRAGREGLTVVPMARHRNVV